VHTSAKARPTSVMTWIRIHIQVHIQIPDPDRHQNLIICSLAHCQPTLKISCKSIWKFLCKVANGRQTDSRDRQTNNDDYKYIPNPPWRQGRNHRGGQGGRVPRAPYHVPPTSKWQQTSVCLRSWLLTSDMALLQRITRPTLLLHVIKHYTT